MSHLDELRQESVQIAEAVEDNEETIRACSGECSDCPRVNTCFN